MSRPDPNGPGYGSWPCTSCSRRTKSINGLCKDCDRAFGDDDEMTSERAEHLAAEAEWRKDQREER